MQQPVIEEEAAAFEPSVRSYDDLFPPLPESNLLSNNNAMGQWSHNNSMRVGSSVVTQVFMVPPEERKMEGSNKFGEGESIATCGNIMKETGAHIEIAAGKDQSLTFLVSGKQNDVLEARRKIIKHFQTQASKQISIPKEHHGWILGKKGERLKELEKQTATKISVPGMNDSSDFIVISGTKEGIEKAEHEIRTTSDQQSKKAAVSVTIPKVYHAFIIGPNQETVNSLSAETGAKINIPPPSVMKDDILITGEKEGVMAAKKRIEEEYAILAKKCTTVSVQVAKSQHRYIIGPKGATIAEILKTTGVSVEMPASDSLTGTITLRGPHDKLGDALSIVYGKANSVQTCDVIAPAWIHKYIIGRKGQNIREITADLPKVHVEFTDKEDKIKIEGPPEEMEKAKELIEAQARELLAKMTFTEIKVDPTLFKHIIGKNWANINRLKTKFNVQISINESGVIRIEGSEDDVLQTKIDLEETIHKMENNKERDVVVEKHWNFKSLKEVREKFGNVQIFMTGEIIKVRGPKEEVDECCRYLEKQLKILSETSHQVEVKVFKQFHKFVIGKDGANIRKIREETKTRIDLPDEGDKSDVITISGNREDVEAAREQIRRIQDELEMIVSEEITIPPKFYNSLIGAKGKLIHSIMEDCGGVSINFPPADSQSDKVTIRGPKEDVERAKQQLLEHANERQLSSFTAEVRAKPEQHKFLIGRNGAKIKKIRDETGARIVFPSNMDEDREAIIIIGKKEAVLEAKAALEASIKDIDNITEGEMHVDPRHHRHFVARRAEVLNQIKNDFRGVMISFPRSGEDSDRVVLKGYKDCIEGAKARITEIIAELESEITVECIIPQKHHRSVMGSKGLSLQNIERDCNVKIKIPEKEKPFVANEFGMPEQVNGDVPSMVLNDAGVQECDIIRIRGQPENCERAKQALLDLVPITFDMPVPMEMHGSIIGQKGRYVRELRDIYDVTIVVSSSEGIIQIIGSPEKVEQAKKALEDKVKDLEEDKKDRELRSFMLQIEVNPEYHPKIIGKGGAVISGIRKQHEVQIHLPKKGEANDHIITITGYENNAKSARDAIMKIVNELNDQVREEIVIDARFHPRLIGSRGRNIHRIMDQFKVEINFPRNEDGSKDLVILCGPEENVEEAKEHLLTLTEEFLQEFQENEYRHQQYQLTAHFEAPQAPTANNQPLGRQNSNPNDNGFIVQGGPWEPRSAAAPNTASVTEFPSFGRQTEPPPQQAPVSGAWGAPRR